ncbi:MAG: TonB-dependent receptor [Siphonobacter sp.]
MRKTLLVFYILLLGIISFSYAQTTRGTLKGAIFTSDHQPAGYVTIQVKDTKIGTLTDEHGLYLIKNVPAGAQTLEIRIIGYQTQQVNVEVQADQILEVPTIQLNEDQKTLQEIIVTGTNPYSRKSSDYVARIPLKNLENPQVYSVVTNELLNQQQVTDLQSAFQNITGGNNAAKGVGSGGVGQSIMLRGFNVYSMLRNGLTTNFVTTADPANLERIEVLKGPSGTLFGSSMVSYGGAVNRITKTPFETFKGVVSYSTGSRQLNRLVVDINTPLNEEKTVLFRLNAVRHTENTFQSPGSQESWLVDPSLTYKVNNRLTLHLDVELFHNGDNSTFYNFGAATTAKSFRDVPINYFESYSDRDLKSNADVMNVFAQASYKLSDQWTSQTFFSSGNTNNKANYLFLTIAGDARLNRTIMYVPSTFGRTQIQQNFIGDFKIASLRNRMVVGVDYMTYKGRDRRLTVSYDAIDLTKNYGGFSIETYRNRLLNPTSQVGYGSDNKTLSAYVSDIINFTDRLSAMLSLRVDHFNTTTTSYSRDSLSATSSYDQTALSPKFGLVYQLAKDKVSLFANYMNGFSNVAPGTNASDGSTINFKPEQANQWEVGVKVALLKDKITGTVSYYDILVKDKVRSVLVNNVSTSVQDATQSSKGFEAEIVATPIKGLNLIAGYAYNDSRYTKAAEAVEGKRPYSTPENMINFWLSYKIPTQVLKGFGLGFGGNHVSDSYANDANTFTIPSYTVLNANLFYDQPNYTLAFKVNNLTDTRYWAGSFRILAQTPRSIVATLTYKF